MKTWLFSVTLLSVAVIGYVDEWNLVHFSKDEQELQDCLKEETDLHQILHENVKDAEIESYVIKKLSDWNHEITIPVESIDVEAVNLVNYLGSIIFTFSKDQGVRVEKAIISALHYCSDSKRVSNRLTGNHDLPYFVQEIPELAAFFNLMFVPQDLYLRNENSLFFIYAFAERALSFLESALGKLNNDLHTLDRELLNVWNRRARLFYVHDSVNRYILHYYSMRSPRPYTHDFPQWFTQRRLVPYNYRYQTNELTWYYEICKYDFLEVLFFGLEMADGGLIDPTNVHNNALTYRDIPQYHVDIMWRVRTEFRRYLDERQNRELGYDFARSSPIFSSLVQSLQNGDRIDGLHLALLFFLRFKSSRTNFATTIRPTKAFPTLVLRAPPDSYLEFPSTSLGLFSSCLPSWNRFKRDSKAETDHSIENYDLKKTDINTLNRDIYDNLQKEYDNSYRKNMTFVNFVQDEVKNPSSTARKILNQACDKYYNASNNYDTNYSKVNGDYLVHFSQSESEIASCIQRHKLFHCDKSYETSRMVGKIAGLAGKILSGKIETRGNIEIHANNLIIGFKESYRKFSAEYLANATIAAVLYCSDEKITSTLKCPLTYYEYLGQIMLVLSDKSLHYD